MIVTLCSCNLFFFPGPPSHLISCLLCLQLWEQLPKQGFWEGSGADSVLPCRDLQPCLPCSLWPGHCLHIPLTHAGAAKSHRESGATALGTLVSTPSLASPHCLCCQKPLSSATTSSQGSLYDTGLELSPPAVVWGVFPSCLAEPCPCQPQYSWC